MEVRGAGGRSSPPQPLLPGGGQRLRGPPRAERRSAALRFALGPLRGDPGGDTGSMRFLGGCVSAALEGCDRRRFRGRERGPDATRTAGGQSRRSATRIRRSARIGRAFAAAGVVLALRNQPGGAERWAISRSATWRTG